MIRVAYFFEHPTVSGAEGSALDLLAHLQEREVKVTAFAPTAGELAERLAGLQVPLEPFSAPKGEAGRRSFARDFKAQVSRFDLVHANTLELARLSAEIAHLTGLPATTHVRSAARIGPRVRELLLRNAALIAVSNAVKKNLMAQGFPSEKIHVIYNGVSLPAKIPPAHIRKALELPENCPLVVWAGQITVRKAPEILLEVAKRCVSAEPNVHFLVLGEPVGRKQENLALWELLKKHAAQPPLAGRLHLLGWRRDCLSVLKEATALLHTAREEPLGRVLIESLACGIAVVASNVGGTPEVLGNTGVMVPPDRPEAFAEAVLALLKDEAKRKEAVGAGRARWRRLFQGHSTASATMNLWTQVLEARNRGAPEA